MTREEAYSILTDYTKTMGLLNHALTVEAAMRAYAQKFGEDQEEWGLVGLLHDFDYEKYPDPKDHPIKGSEILREAGLQEHLIRAILTHAEYLELSRDTVLEKCLFAVDELCGFLVAVALVRPNKKLSEVTVKSVKKKMKDKSFARQVKREYFIQGAEELCIPLDDHIAFTLEALKGIADEIGL